MSAVGLSNMLVTVRTRIALDAFATGLPLVVLAVVLGLRAWGPAGGLVALAIAAAGSVLWIRHRVRRYDAAWLAATLDARRRDLDDSSALLFADTASLGPLQRLQQTRLRTRLAQRPLPDLRPAWAWRTWMLAWLGAGCVLALVWLWPVMTGARGTQTTPVAARGNATTTPALESATLDIQPPAYTGLDAEVAHGLDAKAPAGSRLRWRLAVSGRPETVALAFLDGRHVPLALDDGIWTGTEILETSQLYRVRIAGAEDAGAPLHRLDAVADSPPQVRVLVPETTLQLRTDGQRQWSLVFEARDDYGVAAQARLRIVRTEGTGENQTFHGHVRTLSGEGPARQRRFATTLDIDAFGLQPGEDLVAQLEVHDGRRPQPQAGRSPSVILRWPPPALPDIEGLEGLARDILPAYFRSQRQIIIDAEALLEARPTLASERFADRSDALGVDQRLLRLRYGQFLGEESEGAARPPPTADAHDHDRAHEAPLPRPSVSPGGIFADGSDAPPERPAAEVDAHDHAHDAASTAGTAEGAHDHGDHDHGDGAPADGVFGRAGDVVAAFGHTHDLPEAATLLDPKTRETLRSALREMWQSELHLRQADPALALPYAYRALEFIKQVQEADRIYLPRLGSRLPPIDENRRLGGDREGLASRPLAPLSSVEAAAAPHMAWRALADARDTDITPVLDALQDWVRDAGTRLDDPLAVVAAIDGVRQDPACTSCRDTLRGLLWHAMPRPVGGIAPRAVDAAGAHYLRRLQQDDGLPDERAREGAP